MAFLDSFVQKFNVEGLLAKIIRRIAKENSVAPERLVLVVQLNPQNNKLYAGLQVVNGNGTPGKTLATFRVSDFLTRETFGDLTEADVEYELAENTEPVLLPTSDNTRAALPPANSTDTVTAPNVGEAVTVDSTTTSDKTQNAKANKA